MLIPVPDWLNAWFTPIWMLGVGCLIGLVVFCVVGQLLIWLFPRRLGELREIVSQGPLVPMLWTCLAFIVAALFLTLIVRQRGEILASLLRVPATGERTIRVPLAGGDEAPLTDIPFAVRGTELRRIELECQNDVRVFSEETVEDVPAIEIEVTGGDRRTWDRLLERGDQLKDLQFTTLKAENLGDGPANLNLTVLTAARHPQAATILHTALFVVILPLLYAFQRAFFPRMSAIAVATAKSQMAQPLYLILMGGLVFLLGLFVFLPYHTFGEDIKVLKDSGITLIMVCAVFQAVWAASSSVEDEIEGKTALTVLSKSVSRREFILGKFLGITWASVVFLVILGAWFLVLIAYKPVYDSRETSNPIPEWQECHVEVVRALPGLALALMETLVFIAISVAISTRLPLFANLMICFVIYSFGHLAAQLVQAGEGKLDNVKFMAQFIATILPVLDHFNIQAAIAKGTDVPITYVATAGLYCLLYVVMALLLALVLFEDRDLA